MATPAAGPAVRRWGIGIAKSKHKAEAWKLVSYLMSPRSEQEARHPRPRIPGQRDAKPGYVTTDAIYAKAFEIFKSGYLANEFTGLPVRSS